jgi:hypothetical protein
MANSDLWRKLSDTFTRDTFYYNLGYDLLNGTNWRFISKKQRDILNRLAESNGPVTPAMWIEEGWRIHLFKQLIETSLQNQKNMNELLQEINTTVGHNGSSRRKRRTRRTRRNSRK